MFWADLVHLQMDALRAIWGDLVGYNVVIDAVMQKLNFVLFAIYLLLTVAVGIWVARRKTANARDYFLAGEGLPWYAIGGSIIAANISTEHFIGMVGVAYGVGFVVAQWEWGNVITFSALIWIFLPFYIRGGL